MVIIDTHVHLNDDRLFKDIDAHIQSANDKNVSKMIVIGYDKISSLRAVEIASKYDGVYAAIGIHPSEVHKTGSYDLDDIETLISHPKVVAIGEIGLDYYWDKTYKDLQKEYFIKQIQLANKYNLPISVHMREASLDTFNILKDNPVRGVMHCYSGSLEMAREFVKLGMYLGISGVVTFKNAREIKEVVQAIDLQYLLSETDAPYLTPEPYRGKLNKPEYVTYVVEKISEIKDIPYEEVINQLNENTNKLFNFEV